MDKIRVGFAVPCYNKIGGTEVWHQTLLPRLPTADIEVVGMCIWGRGQLTGRGVSNDMGDWATLLMHAMTLKCHVSAGDDAMRALAGSVDVLVTWAVQGLGNVLPDDGPAVIAVNHGDGENEWSREWLAATEPDVDRFVYVCPSGVNAIPEHRRVDATYVPNAPAPERVERSKSREELRMAWGILPHEKALLSLGRLSDEKRTVNLAAAVRLLPGEYRLLLAGSGPDLEEVRALAGDRLVEVGDVQHPGDVLAAADAMVCVSRGEGFGLSTAEALLAGLPVLSTPVGLLETAPELAAIIPHNATPLAIAGAVLEDFGNCDRQQVRAMLAWARVQELYNVAEFTARWRTLLRETASGRVTA